MILSPFAYSVRHLERVPLGTPLTAQIGRLISIKNQLPRSARLIIDATGVGRALYGMAIEAHLSPIGAVIHGGFEVHTNPRDNIISVPKQRLVSELYKRLELGDISAPRNLEFWQAFRREMMNFRSEMTRRGSESWNSRSGEHDDLVMALCLALFQLTGEHVRYRALMQFYSKELGGPGATEEWAIGVDVGETSDYSAVAVVSKVSNPMALSQHEAA
jgi:hypothetical protein